MSRTVGRRTECDDARCGRHGVNIARHERPSGDTFTERFCPTHSNGVADGATFEEWLHYEPASLTVPTARPVETYKND